MSLLFVLLSLGSFALAAVVTQSIKSDIQLTIVALLLGFAFVLAGQAVIMGQNRRLLRQLQKPVANKLNLENSGRREPSL
jgi:hypothetical protein